MRAFFLLLLFSHLVACKNYLGNPHSRVMTARTVSALNPADILRVEPGNWWVGMQHHQIEILVHYPDLAAYTLQLGPSKGVKVLKIEKGDSPNYLFVTLNIGAKAPPQRVPLIFTKGTNVFTYSFSLLARNDQPKAQGTGTQDVVYLIFPDRFANGNPGNDNIPGMLEGLQRDSLTGRHGGDLQGIADHLDYLVNLGVSAIWLNPELENDQVQASYHGYAITDHYRVDRRFGTNEELRNLIKQCHQREIKVIRDVVLNHIGDGHYWMKDLPTQDWINQWPTFTRTTYRAPTLVDPYASKADLRQFQDGWFDQRMPDLNQRNPHVANYLIQQAIWWIEYAGFDDFRIDTYPYSDQAFCSRWCREVLAEYPKLGMFGEVWENAVPIQEFFANNQPMSRANFDSNLPGVVDFQLCFAIQEALTREQGWTEGASRIYLTLAQDYFYKDPFKNLIMLDNHDFTRFYTTVGENFDKYKSGLAFLLTMRGIPQIYYATEILATGNASPSHGNIRQDFPGGWAGDPANKFTAEGRTAQENEAYDYARALIRYRRTTPALQNGKLMQFVPEDGVYTYFRYDDAKTVMVIMNTANQEKTVTTQRFAERMQGFTGAHEVVTGKKVGDWSKLVLGKNSAVVLELER